MVALDQPEPDPAPDIGALVRRVSAVVAATYRLLQYSSGGIERDRLVQDLARLEADLERVIDDCTVRLLRASATAKPAPPTRKMVPSLRTYREQAGWSLTELAIRLTSPKGQLIDVDTLRALEDGTARAGTKSYYRPRLAQLFGVTPEQIGL